jgi:two-component system OmpR family response regulator
MLPRLDGMAIIRSIRLAGVQTPVLILTALGRIEDRVRGLDAGADDYLVKPFALFELAARLNALGRRTPIKGEVTQLEHRGLILDPLRWQITRDGTAIILQRREFEILQELMRAEGKIVTRSMLLERVWNYHFEPKTNIVDTHISRLRAKLNETGKPDLIETVRGMGYRMAADV